MSEQIYKGWTILVDCDGCLTDGKKHVYTTGQRQMIAFHSRDSIACKMLVEMGFQVIILTHSLFPGIPAYWEKYGAKVHASKIEKSNVVSHFVIDWGKTIGVGDDVTDICYLEKCKHAFIPSDAHEELIELHKVKPEIWKSPKPGGSGILSDLVYDIKRGILNQQHAGH